jgi:hypothetical protein
MDTWESAGMDVIHVDRSGYQGRPEQPMVGTEYTLEMKKTRVPK